MTIVNRWIDGAKVLTEEPETSGPTMSDLCAIVSRLERKVDGLPFFLQAEALKPYLSEELMKSTTPMLEGVTQDEKESLRGDK